jgi:peptidoglycan/xylan/chitin deacetylase (PgdA/CDA1 family)
MCMACLQRGQKRLGWHAVVGDRMGNFLLRFIRSISESAWLKRHPDFLLVLNWHQITPTFDANIHHRYTWTALDTFITAVDYLAAHFRIVPLQEAVERIKTTKIEGQCVALTFDDGDVSIANHVVPLLQRRNLPATIFINTAYLAGDSCYWFPALSHANPPLTGVLRNEALKLRATHDPVFYDEVRRRVEQHSAAVPKLSSRLVSNQWLAGLDGEQFAIGAHGHEHQRYSMMPPDWQWNDLAQNVAILSQFRAYRPLFAVPFGRRWDWNKTTLEIVHKLGLDLLLADGGVNLGPAMFYRRQPADSSSAPDLIAKAILRAKGNSQFE